MKKCWVIFFLLFPSVSFAEYDESEDDIGPGFVEVEGGQFRILDDKGQRNLEDAIVLNLNTGFSITKEFKAGDDIEAFKVGPKVGIIFGKTKPKIQNTLYYNATLNCRYYFGNPGSALRLFFDGGPGFTTYAETGFLLDAGLGVRYLFGTGTFGIHAQYKEVIGSKYLSRGIETLVSLGYQF